MNSLANVVAVTKAIDTEQASEQAVEDAIFAMIDRLPDIDATKDFFWSALTCLAESDQHTVLEDMQNRITAPAPVTAPVPE